MRPIWDEYFMMHARVGSSRSNCITRKVGAVLVRNRIILSTGYNGTPAGIKNCFDGGCERCAKRTRNEIKSGEELERCMCVHAESNALMHCSKLGINAENSTLYTTVTPCLECTKMALTAGVTRFVSMAEYPENARGLAVAAGAKLVHLETSAIKKWLDKC